MTDTLNAVARPGPVIPGSNSGLNIELRPHVAELGLESSNSELLPVRPMVSTFKPANEMQRLPDKATFFQGTHAYLAEESFYRAIYDCLEAPEFSRDISFDVISTFQADKGAGVLSPDLQKELLGAISQEDYQYRWGRIKEKQIAQQAMSEAPQGAFLGAVVDADSLLGMGIMLALCWLISKRRKRGHRYR